MSTQTKEEQTLDESVGANGTDGKSGKRNMTEDHKAAIAAGRVEAAAVNAYLDAMDSARPRPGRKQTPESLNSKLTDIDAALDDQSAKPINRLLLMQERREVEQALLQLQDQPDMGSIEADFVVHAKSYSDRKGFEQFVF